MWGIELDLISVYGSELTWFYCVGQKIIGFSVGIEIKFFLVSRHQNWLDFIVEIEIHLTSVQGSELTRFLRGGRKVLGFSVLIEIDLFFVCTEASKLTWFSSGDRLDLISVVVASKVDCCVRDRIWLAFSVGIEIDLVFVRRIEIDHVPAEINLFYVWWPIYLVFVWVMVVGINSVFGCGPQIV